MIEKSCITLMARISRNSSRTGRVNLTMGWLRVPRSSKTGRMSSLRKRSPIKTPTPMCKKQTCPRRRPTPPLLCPKEPRRR